MASPEIKPVETTPPRSEAPPPQGESLQESDTQSPATSATSRDLQDRLIRYLSDARLRQHPQQGLPLSTVEAEKADRFARFLARRYYRDRLIRSFRYARLLSPMTGRSPEQVVETEHFERLLGDCVLGSLDTARDVAELAVAHLSGAPTPGLWWSDLLQYESGFFLQMATADMGAASNVPQRGVSAILRELSWDVPQLLPRLKARESLDTLLLDDLRRDLTLLFSRTREGKVYVVEVETAVAAVFQAVDGKRTAEQIAAALSSQTPAEINQAITALKEIGAIVGP